MAADATYQAEIRRTAYGIPHIKADDWASLGYGYGYAYAQDNYCVAMRGIVAATGRSAEFFGETEGDVAADFVLRYVFGTKDEFRETWHADADSPAVKVTQGFAAGMNRYLRDTGRGRLPGGAAGCRNADWVFEIDEVDLAMLLSRLALQGSSDQPLVRQAIYDATEGPRRAAGASAVDLHRLRRDLGQFARSLGNSENGSNAIAVGRDLSRTRKGMLLANPHQPWSGTTSFYQVHLTIPGEYDVAGAALHGLPVVGIGFNKDVAWTHTVAFSTRFTLYELQLNPNDPLQYLYDGSYRDITRTWVTTQVRQPDGTLEERRRPFYSTHFGPIVDLGVVSGLLDRWPVFGNTAYAIRDANLDRGVDMLEQYIAMGQAADMTAFTEALEGIGVPVFHTLAVDRPGEAFYGEVAAVPQLTATQLDTCAPGIWGLLIRNFTNEAVLTLKGTDSACEWGTDSDSPPGTNLAGYAARPTLRTTDYVANSNDSYWLSNATTPLTGYATRFGWLGRENTQQQLRTRIGHLMIAERRSATDGLSASPGFTLTTLKKLLYRNRVYAAELVLDDVLGICDGIASSVGANTPQGRARRACQVLRSWDRKVDLGSRGVQVFTEFWRRIRASTASLFTNVVDDSFWATDFDPANPVNTPHGIDVAANRDLVIDALSGAVLALDSAGVALNARWRDVQYVTRGETRIPIHGGDGNMGVYGAVSAGLRHGGYTDVSSGNSYIVAVTWGNGKCPIAHTVLAPGQSDNPSSRYYRDQTRLYSAKRWTRFPYCEATITRAQRGKALEIEE